MSLISVLDFRYSVLTQAKLGSLFFYHPYIITVTVKVFKTLNYSNSLSNCSLDACSMRIAVAFFVDKTCSKPRKKRR